MKISLNFDFTKKRIVFAYGRFCLAKDLSMDGISGKFFQVFCKSLKNAKLNFNQSLNKIYSTLQNTIILQPYLGCNGFCSMVMPEKIFINHKNGGL
jgi:hypothetical protein